MRTILIKVASGFPFAFFIALYIDSKNEKGKTSEFKAIYKNTLWDI
jgi:hypothetical protein